MRRPCSIVPTVPHVKYIQFFHTLLTRATPGQKREAQRRCKGTSKGFITRADQWLLASVVPGAIVRTRVPYVWSDAVMAHSISYMKRNGYLPPLPQIMQMLVADGMLKPGGHSQSQFRQRLHQYAQQNHIQLVYGPIAGKLRVPAATKPERATFAADWEAKLKVQPGLIGKIAAVDEIIKHAYPHPKSKQQQHLHAWDSMR